MSKITMYHNPKCGTSRNTLAMIRNSGVEPKVIHYLETPPGRNELVALIAAMDIPVRDFLRKKGTPYDELIDYMMLHPILINRPIVATPLGTRLCRPSEAVLDLLPNPRKNAFLKENSEAVINDRGERINSSKN